MRTLCRRAGMTDAARSIARVPVREAGESPRRARVVASVSLRVPRRRLGPCPHFPRCACAALSLGGLSVRELILRTWRKINEHEILTRAAAVAFYAMLALVPFLALTLTFTAQLLPDVTDRTGKSMGIGNLTVDELRTTLRDLFPREAYGVVEQQIARLQQESHIGLISLSLAITIWLASSLFVAIIDAMNRIYGVDETRPLWKLRLVAIVMTLFQAIILVGSLLAIVVWPQFVRWMGMSEPAALLATAVQWLVVTIAVLISFALTFYVGPDADQHWEWITPGSLVGTIVFLIVSLLLPRLRPELRQLRQDLRLARRGDGPAVLVLDLERGAALRRADEQGDRRSLAPGQELRTEDRPDHHPRLPGDGARAGAALSSG